jgi:hypothetical protein
MTVEDFFNRFRDDAFEGHLDAIAAAVERLAIDLHGTVSLAEHQVLIERIGQYLALVTWYSVRDVFIRHLLEAKTEVERIAVVQQMNAWGAQNPKPPLPELITRPHGAIA